MEGCLALRVHAADAEGVAVPRASSTTSAWPGTGRAADWEAGCLPAAVARARAQSVGSLFTATVGSGSLFLRHGFAPAGLRLAPEAWATSLDPRRWRTCFRANPVTACGPSA
ncbi:Amino-acid N-acetyltransferase OS=Streptomyces violarus OX=67380 GN=FHS41_000864 PE=4 SV=1 [Streptomyces violarus]